MSSSARAGAAPGPSSSTPTSCRRVLVNRAYYATVTKQGPRRRPKRPSSPIASQTANWLTKSLDQRAQTILKVATEIVPPAGRLPRSTASRTCRPMTLKLVADAIDMHESTVSPRHLEQIHRDPARRLRDEVLLHHRARLIDRRRRSLGRSPCATASASSSRAEVANDILSDDTIAEMLQKEQGIEVARRTVAKYREGMNIPSSVIRRRQKRQMAGVR